MSIYELFNIKSMVNIGANNRDNQDEIRKYFLLYYGTLVKKTLKVLKCYYKDTQRKL
jgi:hypothetical protein